MKLFFWTSLVLFVFVAGIIPFHQKRTFVIKARYENVFNQILKPDSWKNWQQDVKAAWQQDSAQLKTVTMGINSTIEAPDLYIETRLNGFGIAVKKTVKGKSEQYGFVLQINKNFGYTDMYITAKTNGFKWLINILTAKNVFADAKALKQYMEDDQAYYGFQINNTLAIDSNILVVKKTVALKDKDSAVVSTQNHLQAYIRSHRYNITQPVIANIHATDNKDSVRIMMGIPIMQSPKPSGDIVLMQMSKQSRQIQLNYTGRYGNRLACYKSLQRYIADHALSTPEVPYEKYFDNKIPLNDTDYTHMQIICPVQ